MYGQAKQVAGYFGLSVKSGGGPAGSDYSGDYIDLGHVGEWDADTCWNVPSACDGRSFFTCQSYYTCSKQKV